MGGVFDRTKHIVGIAFELSNASHASSGLSKTNMKGEGKEWVLLYGFCNREGMLFLDFKSQEEGGSRV